MRQIKFRGKRLDNGEWVYGDLVHTIKDTLILPIDEGWNQYSVNSETVGQFTGLFDKNGKEIYEGDIVKTPLLDPIFGDILSDAFDNAPIEFSNGSFVVSYYNGNHKIYIQDLYDKIKVIGNIHDNPSLISKKQ